DGSIIYDNSGVEQKWFHVRDGSGLKIWHQVGKKSAIITGRTSRVVEIRAAELGIGLVYQGASAKMAAFHRLQIEFGSRPQQMCAVGDDVPDLGVLASVGVAIAVADACPEVRMGAHYVTAAPGGRGAVREVIELILSAQGRWQSVVDAF